MSTRGRAARLVAPLAALLAASAAFAFVGLVDPNEPGHYPVCPLLRFTGLYCPGCGGLRTAHAVATADLGAALSANAVAVLGFVAAGALWLRWVLPAWRGGPVPPWPLRAAHWWALGAAVAVFSVIRNLPFGAALAP
ncbi:DUF2752 domain-containing protein [Streptomyces oceani]|uniref:DUF2752 domain-containing protein n=1 Tax=Streptomyces oceani TaxID=1075402 RepID=A0A1E7JZA6_9ACTN|nr:DUF2752 domain-containing protein [Streptomyces oceani]OEU97018.1 hypothetical protein AN216_17315 [Streptomyces oceani]